MFLNIQLPGIVVYALDTCTEIGNNTNILPVLNRGLVDPYVRIMHFRFKVEQFSLLDSV